MNIHEYQAKELLQKFGVATTRGKVASTAEEAEAIAREICRGQPVAQSLQPSDAAPPREAGRDSAKEDVDLVVKAQVHAGGRGKGTFANGFKGGVHVVKSPNEAREVAGKMLGQTLVTHQTGAQGRVVNKVLIAESADIAREIYFAILLDRATAAPLIVASTEGGVEIETVAAKTPEK
ncbi:MAG: succinyl-CoA synthetase beta subunit, partial [Verrucomicrobiota bacterium]